MIQKPTTAEQYRIEILQSLATTGVKQLSPGGKARAFFDIVADMIGRSEQAQFYNISQTLLPYATGDSLDAIGQIYGVTRIPRQDGQVMAQDQNFKFYVRSGSFGDINSGNDIYIPAGVRIATLDDDGPVYVTSPFLLLASDAMAYFTAKAVSPGSKGAAPSQVFIRHNFTNYSSFQYGSLLVTNDYGVIGGRDQEEDESYRYRIYLKIRAQSSVNESALRFELLQLPGIQDVVFEPYSGGFTCYVFGISPIVPPSLIALVQSTLNEKVAFPLTAVAVNPDLVGITLSTSIQYTSNVLQSERETVKFTAIRAAEEYINNLGLGQPLIINEIADRLRNADTRILDIGQPNKQIQEIYIWRARPDGSRYSRYLLGNYTPSTGERIVVEPLATPISLV
jgi:hypothetical protein